MMSMKAMSSARTIKKQNAICLHISSCLFNGADRANAHERGNRRFPSEARRNAVVKPQVSE